MRDFIRECNALHQTRTFKLYPTTYHTFTREWTLYSQPCETHIAPLHTPPEQLVVQTNCTLDLLPRTSTPECNLDVTPDPMAAHGQLIFMPSTPHVDHIHFQNIVGDLHYMLLLVQIYNMLFTEFSDHVQYDWIT